VVQGWDGKNLNSVPHLCWPWPGGRVGAYGMGSSSPLLLGISYVVGVFRPSAPPIYTHPGDSTIPPTSCLSPFGVGVGRRLLPPPFSLSTVLPQKRATDPFPGGAGFFTPAGGGAPRGLGFS